MKKKLLYFFALIFCFSVSVTVKAQRHEIGLQLGTSNLVGDIGRTNYILQKPIIDGGYSMGLPVYIGGMYRMNLNPYQTVRFGLGYSHLQFNDNFAKEFYRKNRKLFGTNSVVEMDVLFEYNFFPVNEEQRSMVSPYIFAGISGMLTKVTQANLEHDFVRIGDAAQTPISDTDFVTNQTYKTGNQMTMALPFGIGLKYKFNYNWALSGELTFRPTFSDAIDYSVINDKDIKVSYNKDILATDSKKSLLETGNYLIEAERRKEEFIKDRQVGNINSKDWVNSVSIILSYSFGRPPCYCD